jgi:MFS family permease
MRKEFETGCGPSNYRWYVLLLVSFTFFFANAERMCLPVLFQEILRELDLSLVQIGMVWGMDPLAGVFVSIFSGLLIDRFGVKRTVTVIIFFVGVFGLLRGLSSDFISLACSMFLFGLLVATIPTILPKVIALWFKGRHLGLANGISVCVASTGAMTATMLSATVLSPFLGGWRFVLFLYGVPPTGGAVRSGPRKSRIAPYPFARPCPMSSGSRMSGPRGLFNSGDLAPMWG